MPKEVFLETGFCVEVFFVERVAHKIGEWLRGENVEFAKAGIIGMLWMTSLLMFGFVCGGLYATYDVMGGCEPEPPQISRTTWSPTDIDGGKQIEFRFDMEEVGDKFVEHDGETIGSHIKDFGIIVVEREGANPTDRVTIDEKDPLTEETYHIPIDIDGLIGEPAAVKEDKRWRGENRENREWDVFEGEYSMKRTDDRHAYVEGTIIFENWEPEKYYIIVWAVDEWGNARWVFCDVDDDPVYRLSRIVPNNAGGVVDREVGFWNYHYVFRGRGFVPYCGPVSVGVGRYVYYRGFSMNIPPNVSVVGRNFRILSSDTVWGFMIYRFESIFGEREISVGDETVKLYRDPLLPRPFWDILVISMVFFVIDKEALKSEFGRRRMKSERAMEFRVSMSWLAMALFITAMTHLLFVGWALPFICGCYIYLCGLSIVVFYSWWRTFGRRYGLPILLIAVIYLILGVGYHLVVLTTKYFVLSLLAGCFSGVYYVEARKKFLSALVRESG